MIWTHGRIPDKYAKKRQKTKSMLNVWKKLFIVYFSEKRVLPQKVALETLSPVLTTLLTILRQKTVFSTKIWKNPPAHAPRSQKNYQTEHFSGDKNISRRSVSGQIKTQFWQSAFKVQKTSAECLEKFLKTLIQPRKKTVYLKKPSWIVPSCFDNHAEFFQKQCFFVPNFYENRYNRLLDFRKKVIQLPKIYQVRKSPEKKSSRQIKRILDNRMKCCCQSTTKFCSISEKIS